ncbi:MAG: Sugar transferase [Parcubacteria group bacterium GW2011_GWA2_44_13]|nr:MAG: Sugar transferase [Parcubacteria group bacterium GW2011_GWA2_44_13]
MATAWDNHKFPFFLVYVLWILVFYSAGMYDWEHFPPTRRYYTLRLVTKTMAVNVLIAIMLFYLIPSFSITPRTNLLIDAIFASALIWFWRNNFIKRASLRSKIKVLFFGKTPETENFANYLAEKTMLGYSVELVADHIKFGDIKTFIKERKIDIVVVSKDISQNIELVRMFYEVLPLGVTITNFPDFYESITGKIPTSLINETWFLENLAELNNRPYEQAKRVLDIAAAILLSISAALLFPIIALLIKLESRGSIFYTQKRVGKNGKVFEFIKFRSMIEGADSIDGAKGTGEDERHTRIGKILRKSYLDELPQIINIFRGEMSFVGPRPERPEFVELLREHVQFYETRLLVRPGITGWAQIRMANDASVEDAPEKLQYDLYYVKNRSLLMDLGIMLKTAAILVRREGR